ncbi:hypothetical protein SCWH03_50170 [Streptomyces pacificus]|uniref:Uncharacterized protein n=1 Tax=Streptomyces pacificus TaxID=2705029 RepID=A0A6A0B250_9ACTN|nr:hypothetical protein SCWH03_50170 [Streptomyces pacificus]
MESRYGQSRCVPDVVKGGGGNEQSRILAEYLPNFFRPLRHSLGVRPPARERAAELCLRDLHCPFLDAITHASCLPGEWPAQAWPRMRFVSAPTSANPPVSPQVRRSILYFPLPVCVLILQL